MKFYFYFLVGALTSKPYAFTARSWELSSTETVDFFDTFCSNIRVDTRGSEVMRVLPKVNNRINEEWISDKTRFSYDGLKRQRLLYPLFRNKLTNKLEKSNWPNVFNEIKRLKADKYEFCFILGDFIDLETQLLVKTVSARLGAKIYNQNLSITNVDFRRNYLAEVNDLTNYDLILLLGLNLRFEFPVLNIKIRQRFNDGILIASFGFNVNYNYKVLNLGSRISDLRLLLEGKHLFCKKLVNSNNPLILIGSSFQVRVDSLHFFNFFEHLRYLFKNVFFLQSSLTILCGYELGLYSKVEKPNPLKKIAYYVINADNLTFNLKKKEDVYIIYQGHNGDRTANIADIILPGSSPFEKKGTYIDITGNTQHSNFVLNPSGMARVDWKILKALSDVFDFGFNINKHSDVQSSLKKHIVFNGTKTFDIFMLNKASLNNVPLFSVIENFYLTDSISRSSLFMNLTSKRFLKNSNFNNF